MPFNTKTAGKRSSLNWFIVSCNNFIFHEFITHWCAKCFVKSERNKKLELRHVVSKTFLSCPFRSLRASRLSDMICLPSTNLSSTIFLQWKPPTKLSLCISHCDSSLPPADCYPRIINEIFIFFNLIVKWQIFCCSLCHFCHVLKNKQLNKLDFLLVIHKHNFFSSNISSSILPQNTIFFCLLSLPVGDFALIQNDDVELQIFFSFLFFDVTREKYLLYHSEWSLGIT